MAVERVERLLQQLTLALREARIDYAIIGGNAVAAWVGMVDDAAVRATKDVDVLIRRCDLARMIEALEPIDLVPAEVLGVQTFVTRSNPNPRTGVHVLYAGECVRPHYRHAAPDVTRSVDRKGVRIIELAALVEMKLQSFRFIDRAHVQDLLTVGLIDDAVRSSLPPDLRERLAQVERESDQLDVTP